MWHNLISEKLSLGVLKKKNKTKQTRKTPLSTHAVRKELENRTALTAITCKSMLCAALAQGEIETLLFPKGTLMVQ